MLSSKAQALTEIRSNRQLVKLIKRAHKAFVNEDDNFESLSEEVDNELAHIERQFNLERDSLTINRILEYLPS